MGSSITTRGGDTGETSLLFGRRVRKDHPRMVACGTVDELSACLGLVRATTALEGAAEVILRIQKVLVALMGELAVAEEDLERFEKSKLIRLSTDDVTFMDDQICKWEEGRTLCGWAYAGESLVHAHYHLARAVCRRAEREVCSLQQSCGGVSGTVGVYLNRLSDLLWLLSEAERQSQQAAGPLPE